MDCVIMDVLMSIKPQYVEKIIQGEKTYEFRKTIFKQKVENIVIYCTAPEKKIVGFFELNNIFRDNPKVLWKKFSDNGGICKEDFFKYFESKDIGFALEITNLNILDEFIDVNDLENFIPPQSFMYINKDDFLSKND